eukprot:779288-Rhodomonas_salina.2
MGQPVGAHELGDATGGNSVRSEPEGVGYLDHVSGCGGGGQDGTGDGDVRGRQPTGRAWHARKSGRISGGAVARRLHGRCSGIGELGCEANMWQCGLPAVEQAVRGQGGVSGRGTGRGVVGACAVIVVRAGGEQTRNRQHFGDGA